MKFFRRRQLRPVWADESQMVLEYRRIWEANPILRQFYRDVWACVMAPVLRGPVPAGPVVELGGGAGFIREFYPEVMTTDLNPFPSTQLVCDATRLPFADGSVGSFIAVAFFHHCVNAKQLFGEVGRALKPGGRFVIYDPYISPVARLVYAVATEEDLDLSEPPFETDRRAANVPLLEANVARGTLVFGRHRRLFEQTFPGLRVESVDRINLFRHIVAGSCVQRSPFPGWLYPVAGFIDRALHPVRGLTAMAMRVVLEKTEA